MALARCPTCGRTLDPETCPARPFCSPRCRVIDLNRWLSEEQRLPIPREEEEESAADPAEPPDDD